MISPAGQCNARRRVNPVGDAHALRHLAGHQCGTRRRTHGMTRVESGESHTGLRPARRDAASRETWSRPPARRCAPDRRSGRSAHWAAVAGGVRPPLAEPAITTSMSQSEHIASDAQFCEVRPSPCHARNGTSPLATSLFSFLAVGRWLRFVVKSLVAVGAPRWSSVSLQTSRATAAARRAVA